MNPLTLHVVLRAKSDKADELKSLLDWLLDHMCEEPTLIDFSIHQDSRDPSVFMLYENWMDADEYAKVRDCSYRLRYVRERDPLLAVPPEVVHWNFLRREVGPRSSGNKASKDTNGIRLPRIPPVDQPFSAEQARVLATMMQPKSVAANPVYQALAQREPTRFFRTWLHNVPLACAFQSVREWMHGSSLVPARERELIALRVCALCGFHAEWGLRVAIYGEKVGLSPEQIRATATGPTEGDPWKASDVVLLQAVEQLHASAHIEDETWERLAELWRPAQLLELLFIVGWYHTLSFVGNGARIAGEEWGAPHPKDYKG